VGPLDIQCVKRHFLFGARVGDLPGQAANIEVKRDPSDRRNVSISSAANNPSQFLRPIFVSDTNRIARWVIAIER